MRYIPATKADPVGSARTNQVASGQREPYSLAATALVVKLERERLILFCSYAFEASMPCVQARVI